MLRQNFNDGWKVREQGGFAEWYNIKQLQPVVIPHDYSMEVKRSPDAASGSNTGYFKGGIIEYHKKLFAPPEWQDKSVFLEFEGVYQEAVVKINDNVVAKQPYGYTTFHVNMNKWLSYGEENNIVVIAANLDHNSRWYTGTGIYRPVWLMVGGRDYIKPFGLFVKTNSFDTIQIELDAVKSDDVSVFYTVRDADGKVVVESGDCTIKIPNAVQWDIDNPYLYTLEAKLSTGDTAVTSFGLRTVLIDAKNGLLVNGKSVKLYGGCVHHDNGIVGAETYYRSEERKVELMKKSGYNAVRCAHNPPSPAFLDACDKLGMFVIDETFDCWVIGKNHHDYNIYFEEWWERDFEAMMLRDRNHPSIIMWSTGNEILERGGLSDGYMWAEKLAAFARSYDDTRFITNGLCYIWEGLQGLAANTASQKGEDFFGPMTEKFMAPLDVAGYNYLLSRYESDHEKYPNRVICGTESFPLQAYDNWQFIWKNPFVIGDFVWTSIDYFGEAGIGHVWYNGEIHFAGPYPWHMAWCGDIDVCGFKRPQSYYRDVLWGVRKNPYITVYDPDKDREKASISQWGWQDVYSRWDFAGYEGKMMLVEIYSPEGEVELFLNGKSVGNNATEKLIAQFEIPYEAGELKAVNKDGEHILKTASKAVALRLTPDRTELLQGNVPDLSYITMEAIDKDDNICTSAEFSVNVIIDGPGEIAGFGNSDPLSEEMYNGTSRKLHKGRAMLAVRNICGEAGEISVIAGAEGVKSAVVLING